MRNVLARCTVALVDAARKLQTLQLRVTAREVRDGIEHLEPYGFTSNPHPGAEGVLLFAGGDRSHGVVVCVADRRFRLQGLQSGEVALLTDEGDQLHFKRGRVIEIQTLTLRVKADTETIFDTPLVRFTGDTLTQGDAGIAGALDVVGAMTGGDTLTTAGDQIAGGVSTMKHPHSGVARGNAMTDPPLPG